MNIRSIVAGVLGLTVLQMLVSSTRGADVGGAATTAVSGAISAWVDPNRPMFRKRLTGSPSGAYMPDGTPWPYGRGFEGSDGKTIDQPPKGILPPDSPWIPQDKQLY
jgi:hypothetical protein